jgi:hypothetical protein
MYKADGPVAPPEGQRVEGGRGYPARSIGVAAVVGIDGVLGKDIRVLYPLIMLRTITFPVHHVPEAAIPDPCFEDLVDLPPLISICLEDRWWLIVLGASGEWVRLRKLEFHHWEDRVELGVAWGKLELVRAFSHNLNDLEGSEPLVRELGRRARRFDVGRIHSDSVAYLDLRRGYASAIIVQLELVFGCDERGLGFGHSSSDLVAELIDRFVGRVHAVGTCCVEEWTWLL